MGDPADEQVDWATIRRQVLLGLFAALICGACVTLFRSMPEPLDRRVIVGLVLVLLAGLPVLVLLASHLVPPWIDRMDWRGELGILAAIAALCGTMYLYVLHVRATADPNVVQSCADSFAPNCIPVPPGPSLFPDRHWHRYGHRAH